MEKNGGPTHTDYKFLNSMGNQMSKIATFAQNGIFTNHYIGLQITFHLEISKTLFQNNLDINFGHFLRYFLSIWQKCGKQYPENNPEKISEFFWGYYFGYF